MTKCLTITGFSIFNSKCFIIVIEKCVLTNITISHLQEQRYSKEPFPKGMAREGQNTF